MTAAKRAVAKKTAAGGYASQSYAARMERGRPRIALSLPQEALDRLDAFALKYGKTRTEIVVIGLELIDLGSEIPAKEK